MPRSRRIAPAGMVFHALNRAAAGQTVFAGDGDYAAFEAIMAAAKERAPVRLLAYCIMPNHWHLVVQPEADDALSKFIARLTQIHSQRRHAQRETVGRGHLYQGRFKAFPVQSDEHFVAVCRYVERNPVRAALVRRAEDWRWSSLWRREHGDPVPALLDPWPLRRADDWLDVVNRAEPEPELAALRLAANRGRPFGDDRWIERTAAILGLGSTLRQRGRPRATPDLGKVARQRRQPRSPRKEAV